MKVIIPSLMVGAVGCWMIGGGWIAVGEGVGK